MQCPPALHNAVICSDVLVVAQHTPRFDCPRSNRAPTLTNVDLEPSDPSSGELEPARTALQRAPLYAVASWIRDTNRQQRLISMVKQVRRALPGDPEFGDPLSTAGPGGPQATARAADRIFGDQSTASRELSLGALQVWQSLTQKVSGRPSNREVTLVFTDLVGFSAWALEAGDVATLTLLRRMSTAIEPPLLDAGGQIVKRMGDGIMAVFADPTTAVAAVIAAREGLRAVEVAGYTPRMRAGVHTGHPHRLGSDWLGVDVNIAARVMERAPRGGLVVSQTALDQIAQVDLDSLGVTVRRIRKSVLSPKQAGIPDSLATYRLKTRREPVEDEPGEQPA